MRHVPTVAPGAGAVDTGSPMSTKVLQLKLCRCSDREWEIGEPVRCGLQPGSQAPGRGPARRARLPRYDPRDKPLMPHIRETLGLLMGGAPPHSSPSHFTRFRRQQPPLLQLPPHSPSPLRIPIPGIQKPPKLHPQLFQAHVLHDRLHLRCFLRCFHDTVSPATLTSAAPSAGATAVPGAYTRHPALVNGGGPPHAVRASKLQAPM